MAKGKIHPDFNETKFKARVLELKSGAKVPFAFGLDAKGGDHVVLFHNKKSGKPLLKLVTDNKPQVTVGVFGDATLNRQTVILDCNRKIPGLKKSARIWVKALKPPMLKKVDVLVGGTTFEEEGDEEVTAQPTPTASVHNGAQQTPAPPTEASEPTSDVDPKLLKQLTTTFGKMASLIKNAVTADPRRKDEVVGRVATLKQRLAEPDDLAQLKTDIVAPGAFLNEVAAVAGSETGQQTAGPESPEQPLDETPLPPVREPKARPPLSLVKLARARLELTPVQREAVAGVVRLQRAVQSEFKDDDEQRDVLAAALKCLDDVMDALDERLPDQLDAVLNAEDGQRPPLVDAARKTLASYTRLVDTDPIIASIDGNEVLPDTAIIGPLRGKLMEVSAALG